MNNHSNELSSSILDVINGQLLHLSTYDRPGHDFVGYCFFKKTRMFEEARLNLIMETLIEQCELLRSAFTKEHKTWEQRDNSSIRSIEIERSDAIDIQYIRDAIITLTEEADIAEPPHIHIRLFDLENGQALAILIHHLVCDGISGTELIKLIGRWYSETPTDVAADLKPLTNYREYYERMSSLRNQSSEKLTYWTRNDAQTLIDITPNSIPGKRPYRDFTLARLDLTAAFSTMLDYFIKYSIPLDCGLYTLVLHALSQQFGSGIYPVWVLNSGRGENRWGTEFAKTLGFLNFLNIVYVPIDASKNIQNNIFFSGISFETANASALEFAANYWYQDRLNSSSCHNKSDLRALKKPKIMFNYSGGIGLDSDPVLGDSIELNNLISGDNARQFDLEFKIIRVKERIIIAIRYDNISIPNTAILKLILDLEHVVSETFSGIDVNVNAKPNHWSMDAGEYLLS